MSSWGKLILIGISFLVVMGLNAGILAAKLFFIPLLVVGILSFYATIENLKKWNQHKFTYEGERYKKASVTTLVISIAFVFVGAIIFLN